MTYSHYISPDDFIRYTLERHHAVTRGFYDTERRRLKLAWHSRHSTTRFTRHERHNLLSRLKWLRRCVRTEQSLLSRIYP